jgi:hypothetical protein
MIAPVNPQRRQLHSPKSNPQSDRLLGDVLANRTGDDSWGGVGTNKTPPKEGRGLKVGIFNEKPFSGLNPNW